MRTEKEIQEHIEKFTAEVVRLRATGYLSTAEQQTARSMIRRYEKCIQVLQWVLEPSESECTKDVEQP